ncbi:MAG TPA: DUF4864 domain-containing protein [Bdellovibrionota bacterium]|nr:DUF4864 domain-containing protein [Bdellovibrionota bacterium]
MAELQTPTQPMPEAPKKKTKLPKILFITFILILAIGAGAYYLSQTITAAPTKVAENFLQKLTQQNLDEAYNLTSSQFKSAVTPDVFQQFLQQYPILTQVTTVKFSFQESDDKSTRLSGELTGKGGETAPITMVVVKEDKKWRVLNLSLNPADVPRGVAGEE